MLNAGKPSQYLIPGLAKPPGPDFFLELLLSYELPFSEKIETHFSGMVFLKACKKRKPFMIKLWHKKIHFMGFWTYRYIAAGAVFNKGLLMKVVNKSESIFPSSRF